MGKFLNQKISLRVITLAKDSGPYVKRKMHLLSIQTGSCAGKKCSCCHLKPINKFKIPKQNKNFQKLQEITDAIRRSR